MSNEHPNMHGNPMDAPFLCHQCEKEVREDRAYGSDTASSEMFCSLECVSEWQESKIATLTAENNRYHDEAETSDALVMSLQEEVKLLTRERDEARKEVAWQKKKVRNLQMAADAAGRVDLLSQIAALKSAPGMEDIDALGASAMKTLAQIVLDRPEDSGPAIDVTPKSHYANLRDLIDAMRLNARHSIAAREEAVGLLKHILSCIITVKQENTPEWMEYIAEEVNKINEAIGDPDRVSLRFGGIVIVKGGPEIVEGK